MVSIPISTNIEKTIASLIYLYSDNGNKQYRRMQTNKTSTRKRMTERETCQPHNTTERETCQPHNMTERRASITTEQFRQRERERRRERCASLTTELRNMDRSSNSEQHRQMRERRTSEEREQHRSTNSEKRRNHDHNNLVSYQCIKYFTKLTNSSGFSTGLASIYNYILLTG